MVDALELYELAGVRIGHEEYHLAQYPCSYGYSECGFCNRRLLEHEKESNLKMNPSKDLKEEM